MDGEVTTRPDQASEGSGCCQWRTAQSLHGRPAVGPQGAAPSRCWRTHQVASKSFALLLHPPACPEVVQISS